MFEKLRLDELTTSSKWVKVSKLLLTRLNKKGNI
jgi:hypothetical protein